jgi:hypothetical protein
MQPLCSFGSVVVQSEVDEALCPSQDTWRDTSATAEESSCKCQQGSHPISCKTHVVTLHSVTAVFQGFRATECRLWLGTQQLLCPVECSKCQSQQLLSVQRARFPRVDVADLFPANHSKGPHQSPCSQPLLSSFSSCCQRIGSLSQCKSNE